MNYKSPLNIYVIWHPDFKEGKKYADKIYQTFNRDTEFVLGRNLNIPVFYRSEAPKSKDVPISINYKEGDCNAVIALMDDEMFYSDSWEAYIQKEVLNKIKSKPKWRLFPISFSKNASKIAEEELSRLQFIRVNTIHGKDENEEFAKKWSEIRSRLLHDLSRLLYSIESVGDKEDSELEGYSSSPNPPVKIFLSHAKKDGLKLAKGIKDYIQSEHQLDTFFDANDIATSYRFDDQILKQFNEDMAVIVILSDNYSTREWCKLEASTAKREKCPIVVVSQLEKGEVRSFPYLGNVPILVWNNNFQNIIDLTLIQVLNSRYSKLSLNKQAKLYGLVLKYQCIIFSNPPELFNYLDILDEDNKRKKDGMVIYPDPPIVGEEMKVLKEVMDDIIFTTPMESFKYLE